MKVLSGGMLNGKTDDEIQTAIKVFLDPEAGTLAHGRPIFATEAKGCDLKVEDLDVHKTLWENIYELYARTDFFVSQHACKAVESKEESFYVGI